MKARARRKLKATGQLAVMRTIRVCDDPKKERLLNKLLKKGVNFMRPDGANILETLFTRLGIPDRKYGCPLLAVNNNTPIYAEPLKPGHDDGKTKHWREPKRGKVIKAVL